MTFLHRYDLHFKSYLLDFASCISKNLRNDIYLLIYIGQQDRPAKTLPRLAATWAKRKLIYCFLQPRHNRL